MAKIDRTMVFRSLLLNLLLCSSWIQISYSSKPIGVARKDDGISFKCQVCKKLAEKLHQQVEHKKAKIETKKITEPEVIEISKNVCNLKKQEADWILKSDIVEQGDKLELVEQDSKGQCGSGCKTIERACQAVTKEHYTDVAKYICTFKPKKSSLISYLCKERSKACLKKKEWMKKITKGITDASEATKKYANKMVSEMQEWCKEKKASFTQQNPEPSKDDI